MSANLGPGIYADAGGTNSALNISAAAIIKAAPGRLVRVTVIVAPASTAAVFNDCATTGAAGASNTILSIPAATVAGTIYYLNWPCLAGIVLSAPSSGTFAVSFS